MHQDTAHDAFSDPSRTAAETERRYNQLIGAISDYVCSVDVCDGRAVSTHHSENCIAVTGYTPVEFAADAMLWIRLVVREDRPLVTKQVEQILSGHSAPTIEHRLRRKDGKVRWVLNTPIPFFNADRQLVRYDAVIRDVTGRRSAERDGAHGAPDVQHAAELLRDDLLQLLTAVRFRIESLAGNAVAAPEITQALRDVNELLKQCGRKARTISRKLAIDSALDYEM